MEFISKPLAQLHRGLLVSALRVLAGGDRQARSEVLHWVFAEAAAVECEGEGEGEGEGEDGGEGEGASQHTATPQSVVPFSFDRCCEFAGVDACRMRERLLGVLARLGSVSPSAQAELSNRD